MLAPGPGQRQPARPVRILSKAALERAWNECRDSTTSPGRPGVDGVKAQQFAAKLDANLSRIARDLREGSFGFSALRAVFIPKSNSDRDRLICIPTVQDRLVQRAIASYLNTRRLLPVYRSSSFGFIKGRGTKEAIAAVIKYRAQYRWCLKTDIEAFFDRIPRAYLRGRIDSCLGKSSLIPLLYKVIDSEAKVTPQNREKFTKQKIRRGCGVRQGMPLSPLLANLALSEFDREIEKIRIPMVRYADDLAFFFHSKDDALAGKGRIVALLEKIQLTIPEISRESKTAVISHDDKMDFLGREIVHLGSTGSFVARIGTRQRGKIRERLSSEFTLKKRMENGGSLQATVIAWRSRSGLIWEFIKTRMTMIHLLTNCVATFVQ